MPCRRESKRAYYAKNGDPWVKANRSKANEKARKYARANPEKVKALNAAWMAANKDKTKARKAAWYAATKEQRATTRKAYEKANPEKVNAKDARRKAAKLRAMPAWANQFFIEETYDLAQRRSKLFGFKWHVDHVVPLQSSVVCGLHVPANLAVIPWLQNHAKGNRYWPGMP